MPVCSSGSEPKAATPAVIFLSTEAAVALVSGTLLTPVWADIVAYAASQSFTASTLCGSDPPAMPSFTASDVIEILAGNPLQDTSADVKLGTLIEIAAWYAFCQCSTGSTPAPPAAPAYPTGAPTINPTGGTPGPTTQGCPPQYAELDSVPTFLAETLIPNVPVDSNGYAAAPSGARSVTFSVTNVAVGTNNQTIVFEYFVRTPDYSHTYGSSTNSPISSGQTGTFTVNIDPGGAAVWAAEAYTANSGGTSNHLTVQVTFDCISTTNCCPPDPTVVATLQQIINALSLIYSALPAPVHSYADGTAHTALSGSGVLSIGPTTLAVKVQTTTLPLTYSEYSGSPDVFLDLGFITFESDAAPYANQRVMFATQIFNAPQLATLVHYTFPPGMVATLTEVTAGP